MAVKKRKTAKKAAKKVAKKKARKQSLRAQGKRWAREIAVRRADAWGMPAHRLQDFLMQLWESTEPKEGESILEFKARVAALAAKEAQRLGRAQPACLPPPPPLHHEQNPNCGCQLVDNEQFSQQIAQSEYSRQPPPALMPMVPVPYPATMTPPPQAPGEVPRRVPVPMDATNLSERERRAITASLVAEEGDLDRLADLHTQQGARETADQLQRTAAAVRGDVMRLRFRDSFWAALGHLERLIDKSEVAGVPELEDHLRRVDRALQGAVTSIVQEMRGVGKSDGNLPQ